MNSARRTRLIEKPSCHISMVISSGKAKSTAPPKARATPVANFRLPLCSARETMPAPNRSACADTRRALPALLRLLLCPVDPGAANPEVVVEEDEAGAVARRDPSELLIEAEEFCGPERRHPQCRRQVHLEEMHAVADRRRH